MAEQIHGKLVIQHFVLSVFFILSGLFFPLGCTYVVWTLMHQPCIALYSSLWLQTHLCSHRSYSGIIHNHSKSPNPVARHTQTMVCTLTAFQSPQTQWEYRCRQWYVHSRPFKAPKPSGKIHADNGMYTHGLSKPPNPVARYMQTMVCTLTAFQSPQTQWQDTRRQWYVHSRPFKAPKPSGKIHADNGMYTHGLSKPPNPVARYMQTMLCTLTAFQCPQTQWQDTMQKMVCTFTTFQSSQTQWQDTCRQWYVHPRRFSAPKPSGKIHADNGRCRYTHSH